MTNPNIAGIREQRGMVNCYFKALTGFSALAVPNASTLQAFNDVPISAPLVRKSLNDNHEPPKRYAGAHYYGERVA